MPKRKYQTIVPENYRSAIKNFQLNPLNKKSFAELNSNLRQQGLTPVRIDDLLRGLDIVSPTWREYHQKNLPSTDLKSFGLRKTTGQPIYSIKKPLKRIGPKSVWYCLTNQDVKVKKRRCSNLEGCTPNVDCSSTRDVFPPLPPRFTPSIPLAVTISQPIPIQTLLIETSNDLNQIIPSTKNLEKLIELIRDPLEKAQLQSNKELIDQLIRVLRSERPKPLPIPPIKPIIPSNNDALPVCERELKAQKELLEKEIIQNKICQTTLISFQTSIDNLTLEKDKYIQELKIQEEKCTKETEKEMKKLKEDMEKIVIDLSQKFKLQQQKDRKDLEDLHNRVEELGKQHQQELRDIQSMSVETPVETINNAYMLTLKGEKEAKVLAIETRSQLIVNQAIAEKNQIQQQLDNFLAQAKLANNSFNAQILSLNNQIQLKDTTIQSKDDNLRASDTQRGALNQALQDKIGELQNEINGRAIDNQICTDKIKDLQKQLDEIRVKAPKDCNELIELARKTVIEEYDNLMKKQEIGFRALYEQLTATTLKNAQLLGQLNSGLGRENSLLREEFAELQHDYSSLKEENLQDINGIIEKSKKKQQELEERLKIGANINRMYDDALDTLRQCELEKAALEAQLKNLPQLELNLQAYIDNETRKDKDINRLNNIILKYQIDFQSLRAQLAEKNALQEYQSTVDQKQQNASQAIENSLEYIQRALNSPIRPSIKQELIQKTPLPPPSNEPIETQTEEEIFKIEQDQQMLDETQRNIQQDIKKLKDDLTTEEFQMLDVKRDADTLASMRETEAQSPTEILSDEEIIAKRRSQKRKSQRPLKSPRAPKFRLPSSSQQGKTILNAKATEAARAAMLRNRGLVITGAALSNEPMSQVKYEQFINPSAQIPSEPMQEEKQ